MENVLISSPYPFLLSPLVWKYSSEQHRPNSFPHEAFILVWGDIVQIKNEENVKYVKG